MKKKKINNPVAKFAGEFNRAVTFRDRKKDYKRSNKHRGRGYDQIILAIRELFVDNLLLRSYNAI